MSSPLEVAIVAGIASFIGSLSDFRMICIKAFLREREFRDVPAILEGDIWAHEASYKELAKAMRRVVHLNTLDGLLLPPNNEAQKSLVADSQ